MNRSKNGSAGIFSFDTFGWIGMAALLVCTISGIFLAIPYDVNDPYRSISHFLIFNPSAVLFRNMHYWSAQLFLVMTLLHIYDHYRKKTEGQVSHGVWIRLILSLLFVFFVMLSGFILKGDADSVQARNILASLVQSLPLAGSVLEFSVLGTEGSYGLIYVHHIATATIILFIVIIEHIGSFWPRMSTVFLTTLFIVLMSFFFHAPLHDGFSQVFKGPWYFVGFQEILHWLSVPAYGWLIIATLLGLMYLVRYLSPVSRHWVTSLILFLTGVYLLLSLTGYFLRGENWSWQLPWQSSYTVQTPFILQAVSFNDPLDYLAAADLSPVMGREESCMVCHHKVSGFAAAHDPAALGCASCHGGNPFSMGVTASHRGMALIPGNLDDAKRSCGTTGCHPDIPDRLDRSIMTTLSGIVSVDRYVFHESDVLSSHSHIMDIGHTAADRHLRDMCAHCHLGNPKTEAGIITQLSRGGGCNACHLNYPDTTDFSLNDEEYLHHPRLSVDISDDHCFGCHSRSGRIATNYEGWHETLLENPGSDSNQYRVLEDKRVFRYIGDDVHHAAGMRCIDCHHSYELMGDGELHFHKEGQLDVGCGDCHTKGERRLARLSGFDKESSLIASLRELGDTGRYYLSTAKGGVPLVNTFVDDEDLAWMLTKEGGDTLLLKPPARECLQGNAHDELTCSACHTSWAPQCIGCHNAFDASADGYDLLEGKTAEGSWVEYVGQYLAGPPTLGISFDTTGRGEAVRFVRTYVPGMIMSIDRSGYEDGQDIQDHIFHRLFAPAEAHTTARKGRTCISCHNDPVALGYGRGELVFEMNDDGGRWTFRPKYELNKHDGLPEDAWTGFLEERDDIAATRGNARPFNLQEQKTILTAGSCLLCHKGNGTVMIRAMDDWEAVLGQLSSSCRLPLWER